MDAMLALQEENGFWSGGPNFSTMDAVYLLSRLPKDIGWREDDSEAALHRVLNATIPYYETNSERIRQNTHQFSAAVQTLALLSEALGERFDTSYPWRFGWSNQAIWQCNVIRETLESGGDGGDGVEGRPLRYGDGAEYLGDE